MQNTKSGITDNRLIKILSCIMAGTGLLNIILIFAPWLNLSYAGLPASTAKPSLFKILYDGIAVTGGYMPIFTALIVVIAVALILYIVYFVTVLMKKENNLKYSMIASAIFFLYALSAYIINILCFAEYGSSSVGLWDYIYFTISGIVPKFIMSAFFANTAITAIIHYERKRITA